MQVYSCITFQFPTQTIHNHSWAVCLPGPWCLSSWLCVRPCVASSPLGWKLAWSWSKGSKENVWNVEWNRKGVPSAWNHQNSLDCFQEGMPSRRSMVFWNMFNDPFIWALDLCVSCNTKDLGIRHVKINHDIFIANLGVPMIFYSRWWTQWYICLFSKGSHVAKGEWIWILDCVQSSTGVLCSTEWYWSSTVSVHFARLVVIVVRILMSAVGVMSTILRVWSVHGVPTHFITSS